MAKTQSVRAQSEKLRYLTTLSLLVAVELAMKLLGLDNVQLTPFLKTSFLTVPIALGAMLLGPLAGTVLGGVFGLCSLMDAIRGASAMTNLFFTISPFHTVVLCLGTRMLMGCLTGWVFRGLQKIDKTRTVCYYVGGLSAPLLNTLFFMTYLMLVFSQTEFIQNMFTKLGAANPFHLVVLMVGVQGTIEWLVGLLVGGTVSKAVAAAVTIRAKKKTVAKPEDQSQKIL